MIGCRFLYILYVSVDANFKLKGKDRSRSEERRVGKECLE